MKVKEKIFRKHYCGDRAIVLFKDFPPDLLPTDEIEIRREESFYSENNSWEAYTELIIYRERDETPAEIEKRETKEKFDSEWRKKRRYESYLSLKKEFDGID